MQDRYSLFSSYDTDRWCFVTEFSYTEYERMFNQRSFTGYLSAGYRIDDFCFYGTIGYTKSWRNSPQLTGVSEVDEWLLDFNEKMLEFVGIKSEHRSLTTGVRWDFCDQMACKLQWEHYWITDNGNYFLRIGEGTGEDSQLDLVSLSVDFLF